MTISIENAQTLTNLRAIESQKTADLLALQQTTESGMEATIEDQIAAKEQEIISLGSNPNKLSADDWNAAMTTLQTARLTLIDQNRAIQERNATRQGDISAKVSAAQDALATAQAATTAFLQGLETGVPDSSTPAVAERLAAIESTLLQIAGV